MHFFFCLERFYTQLHHNKFSLETVYIDFKNMQKIVPYQKPNICSKKYYMVYALHYNIQNLLFSPMVFTKNLALLCLKLYHLVLVKLAIITSYFYDLHQKKLVNCIEKSFANYSLNHILVLITCKTISSV